MLSSKAKALLRILNDARSPNEYLEKRYKNAAEKDVKELNSLVGELEIEGYVSVFWADNIAYHIMLTGKSEKDCYTDDKGNQNHSSIVIGNNNKIVNTTIVGNDNTVGEKEKKTFWEKNPFLTALITAVLAAFIMLFSFWDRVVSFIEGLFK